MTELTAIRHRLDALERQYRGHRAILSLLVGVVAAQAVIVAVVIFSL